MNAYLYQSPTPPLTRAQGQAFQQRWQAGPEAEAEEWAIKPLPEKFRRLAGLMASGQQLGMTEAWAADEDEVRPSWASRRRGLNA